MKIHAIYKISIFVLLLLIIVSYRQYMQRVSKHLASSNKELWDKLARSHMGSSSFKAKLYSKKKGVAYRVPTRGYDKSVPHGTKNEASNTNTVNRREMIPVVPAMKKDASATGVVKRKDTLEETLNKIKEASLLHFQASANAITKKRSISGNMLNKKYALPIRTQVPNTGIAKTKHTLAEVANEENASLPLHPLAAMKTKGNGLLTKMFNKKKGASSLTLAPESLTSNRIGSQAKILHNKTNASHVTQTLTALKRKRKEKLIEMIQKKQNELVHIPSSNALMSKRIDRLSKLLNNKRGASVTTQVPDTVVTKRTDTLVKKWNRETDTSPHIRLSNTAIGGNRKSTPAKVINKWKYPSIRYQASNTVLMGRKDALNKISNKKMDTSLHSESNTAIPVRRDTPSKILNKKNYPSNHVHTSNTEIWKGKN